MLLVTQEKRMNQRPVKKSWYLYRKKLTLCILSLVLVFSGIHTVFAEKTTEEKLSETGDVISELQKKSQEAKEQLENAKKEQREINEKLDELHAKLEEMQLILQSIDDKIVAKNAQISETETELAQMEELRQQRYDAMKIRIRFMYENSDRSLLDTLFGAYSMSDFLNRVEYFSQVMDYDRAQLTEYQSLLDGLAEKQDTYQLQKEELVALQEEQQKEVDKLSEIVAQTRTQLDLAKEETAGAKQEVSELDSQLEAQLAYEAVLEAQKAAEDKARMEEIKRQEEELRRQREEEERRRREEEERRRQEAEENGTEPEDIEDSQPASAEDLELLACIIQCEAEGEPYAGKLAVGSVVMNRVASSSFPNTIMGVIYQPGQFSPVASGRMAARLAAGANSECRQAAQEVLNGNITVPYLYFRVDNGTIDGYVLGNHVFY